jgi:teichuronic acid biosynthesis glycosyltransferase TuaG
VQNQTFNNWELIVVDDCSVDSTCSVIRGIMADDTRIRLVKNDTNMGVAETRNRGLDVCKGKYIAFLDSDDIWYPNKLEQQIKLAEKESADIVYSSYDIIDENGNKVKSSYIVPQTASYEQLLKENMINTSAVVINREIAEKYRFNKNFYHEDYVFWATLLKSGYKAVGVEKVCVAYRIHFGSRSYNKVKAAINRWIVYRKYLRLSFMKSVKYIVIYAALALKKYR